MSNTEAMRAAFEEWYIENGFDYTSPIGSRDFVLQWSAWKAALAQAEQRQGAPAGWTLVPVEPTITMCLAGAAARLSVECPTPAEAAYRAMLAAAPQPEEHKQHAPGLYLDSGEFIPAEELNKARNKE